MKTIFTCLAALFFGLFFQQIFAQDTISRRFDLGEITVTGFADSLMSNSLNAETINKFNRYDVSHALNLLPGITLSAVGPRNESAVNVRGFDLRQVPVYLDGIPVYVPYDGYVDLARFTTFDLAHIQVAKGYSSVLYGPNAEGGAINLVSRRPVNRFEGNAGIGWMNGGYRLNTNLGSRLEKFYFQFSASQLRRDYFPLSDKFTPTATEDGGRRNNSASNDVRISGKIGFTPTDRQEYAIGYAYQQGEKGNPVYTGYDSQNSLLRNPRFWKWPNWDKQNVYFISNNTINAANRITTRWYYDQFKNTLKSFDNAGYEAMTRGYAFTSLYNDYTLGNSIVFENTTFRNNNLSIAGHFKQDVHRENNEGEPVRRNADNNFTIGAEDTYQITQKLKFNAGISYMVRKSLATQQYNSRTESVYDLPANRNDAWNIQGLLSYTFTPQQSLNFSVARKTRFATIKDRYSFRLGTAIPNPDLKAEDALNYALDYSGFFTGKTFLQASAFYSRINNSIQTVNNVQFDEATNTNLSQIQNTGKAEYYGAEAGLGYSALKVLQLNANYTFIVRKNLSKPEVFFTDVPKHKVFATVTAQPLKNLSLIASEEYNSKRYSTSYGTVAGELYLTNFKAAYTFTRLTLETGVNNLFDRNYQLAEGFPEQGRNFMATLLLHY
ncbi:MAG: TonB-dependent receptor [Mucilaginibacter polytrichastri]|nr:TonB-dependent receptor [Mucilaginibacter polytrichastri]